MNLATYRRAAVSHKIVQCLLCLCRVGKIPGLQHLAFVSYHLIDVDGVDFAVVRTIKIDAADILVLVRQFSQPGASHYLFSGDRVYPDFSAADIARNVRPVIFPPVNLTL